MLCHDEGGGEGLKCSFKMRTKDDLQSEREIENIIGSMQEVQGSNKGTFSPHHSLSLSLTLGFLFIVVWYVAWRHLKIGFACGMVGACALQNHVVIFQAKKNGGIQHLPLPSYLSAAIWLLP